MDIGGKELKGQLLSGAGIARGTRETYRTRASSANVGASNFPKTPYLQCGRTLKLRSPGTFGTTRSGTGLTAARKGASFPFSWRSKHSTRSNCESRVRH